LKNIYTWKAVPAKRNLTVADLQASKGKKIFTQVTANNEEEALAAGVAGIDMIICNAHNVEAVRRGNNELFLTAALGLPDYPTKSDVINGAFKALELGADAIMTARSMSVVSMLANEDIPVMGHLGLVPRKSTWTGGLRAIGKTSEEAFELYNRFKKLEEAGAFAVEAEVITCQVMQEISKKTSLITVSLGSGRGGDVMYLFMQDICGEQPTAPRHARAFANLWKLKQQIKEDRITALKNFRQASLDGNFPSDAESTSIGSEEFEKFLTMIK
tara:strand:- start:168 stop:983 length:816 start_codon:yes stop_codon:yes gene_type:complete